MSKVTRRAFLQGTATVAATTMLESTAAAAAPHGHRNVLFIAVDDQNTRLGCYGNSIVKTPNIDSLAARGTRFDKAYCQYPLCSPSRTSLMTGLAPDRTQVYDLTTNFRSTVPPAVTIPELFRRNGYYSARVGKIFHADVPGDIGRDGLDDPASWDYVFNPQGVDHPKEEPEVTNYTPQLTRHSKTGAVLLGSTISYYESPSPDRAMTDGLGADEMIRLLREKRDKPFFLAYGLYRPHVPWIVPKAYFEQYPLESMDVAPFTPEETKHAPAAAYTTNPPNYGMDDVQQRKAIRAYYASSSFMDAQAGRVLGELKDLGLEKNTVVVFWADHGWSLGEHGQWEKQTVFESAARVPLIFAGPGISGGQVCRRTVEHLDIYPTLAEICGLKGVTGDLHGKSLEVLLRKPSSPWSKVAVSQVTRPPVRNPTTIGYSLRNERYRYTIWQGAQTGEELYDYEIDPRELNNLAASPDNRTVCDDLRRQLAAITKSRGRTMELGKLVEAREAPSASSVSP